MNVENILKVADAIEQHSIPNLGFNMALWYAPAGRNYPDNSGRNCGTVACIAGWAYSVARGLSLAATNVDTAAYDAGVKAKQFLGLTEEEASRLFMPHIDGEDHDVGRCGVKPERAIAVLRHLAKTRKIDWSVA